MRPVTNWATCTDILQVRAKMLQASSRAGLMKALGGGNFKHDWFATQAVSFIDPFFEGR
jgi:hypothetical protein